MWVWNSGERSEWFTLILRSLRAGLIYLNGSHRISSLVCSTDQVVGKCHWMKKGKQAFLAYSSLARTLHKYWVFFHFIFICSSGKTATVRKAGILEQFSLKTFLQHTIICQLLSILSPVISIVWLDVPIPKSQRYQISCDELLTEHWGCISSQGRWQRSLLKLPKQRLNEVRKGDICQFKTLSKGIWVE